MFLWFPFKTTSTWAFPAANVDGSWVSQNKKNTTKRRGRKPTRGARVGSLEKTSPKDAGKGDHLVPQQWRVFWLIFRWFKQFFAQSTRTVIFVSERIPLIFPAKRQPSSMVDFRNWVQVVLILGKDQRPHHFGCPDFGTEWPCSAVDDR